MGPIQLKNYQALVDDAVKKGAKLLAGGYIPSSFSKNAESKRLAKGFFYPPTVLADVPEDALIVQEEIFGPIMCIIKVRSSAPAMPTPCTVLHRPSPTHQRPWL
jgi:succinate-semialdehyde dehydrogenase/glutarate-semialdehyde dehydrogenase